MHVRGSSAIGLLLLALGCGPAKHEGKTTRLVVEGTPSEAVVQINEQPLGTLATVGGGIGLPAGQHRLTVQAPGYFPADVLLEIGPEGGTRKQKIELAPIPEP